MESIVIQIRSRGTVTLPARVRERYGLAEGDPLTLIDLDGVLLLAPKVSIVRKLADEIGRLRESEGIELDGLLKGDQP
jgi:AbrB family looped-hinge helix DNA binding protein